jgi:hypothetical protein
MPRITPQQGGAARAGTGQPVVQPRAAPPSSPYGGGPAFPFAQENLAQPGTTRRRSTSGQSKRQRNPFKEAAKALKPRSAKARHLHVNKLRNIRTPRSRHRRRFD